MYDLKYNRNLEQIEKPLYFRIGGAFHTGVELYRKGSSISKAIVEAKSGFSNIDNATIVAAMLTGWHKNTKEFYRDYEVIEVEMEFEYRYAFGVKDYFIAGVIDALVRDKQGRVFILENKPTSDTLERFTDRLWAARQGLLYHWALRQLGYQVDGVIYDVIKKPTMKRRLATPVDKRKYKKPNKDGVIQIYAGQREEDETADAYYDRLLEFYGENKGDLFAQEVMTHTPAQMEAMDDDFKGILNEYLGHVNRKEWPRSLGACHAWNRTCEFQPYCGAGNNEVILQTLFKERKRVFNNLIENGGESKNELDSRK